MAHAGYPGPENVPRDRELLVTLEEKHRIENPTFAEILSKAFRGFGLIVTVVVQFVCSRTTGFSSCTVFSFTARLHLFRDNIEEAR